MWVLLIGWNMMLQHLNCHWGHLHEKFSRGERHQLILSQLFSRDALWQLPWHPVTRRDQRLAMEPDSCELTSNEKRETSAALRRSLCNLRAELPSQPSSTTTCSSKNCPSTLLIPAFERCEIIKQFEGRTAVPCVIINNMFIKKSPINIINLHHHPTSSHWA